jgi:hypothetical protein
MSILACWIFISFIIEESLRMALWCRNMQKFDNCYELCFFARICGRRVYLAYFHHQSSPRVSPRESTQRRKVELWARNVREFCLNCRLTRYISGSLRVVKSKTWDRRIYFPSEKKTCWGFFFSIVPTASTGCEPANLGTKGQHGTSRPPEPLPCFVTFLQN